MKKSVEELRYMLSTQRKSTHERLANDKERVRIRERLRYVRAELRSLREQEENNKEAYDKTNDLLNMANTALSGYEDVLAHMMQILNVDTTADLIVEFNRLVELKNRVSISEGFRKLDAVKEKING